MLVCRDVTACRAALGSFANPGSSQGSRPAGVAHREHSNIHLDTQRQRQIQRQRQRHTHTDKDKYKVCYIFQKQGVQGFKIIYWLFPCDDKDKDTIL